ncbi:hypothetical protein HELRODRAFT_161813 [Helobdella robusta]|uniref:SRCR domain-containing protein n=1 Tax=Helobdella robusta TaxID=6412 RepID=T1ERX9_HELRO|nr:hypothetical protein HELRODRAFT_161813 [Helobdella robusta]ESO02532.1 hypothetical protein HELRODRAFT_161813 [Helobdella robusta]
MEVFEARCDLFNGRWGAEPCSEEKKKHSTVIHCNELPTTIPTNMVTEKNDSRRLGDLPRTTYMILVVLLPPLLALLTCFLLFMKKRKKKEYSSKSTTDSSADVSERDSKL